MAVEFAPYAGIGVGFIIHGIFFGRLLDVVPKESQEPYLERLRRYYPASKFSAIAEICNALYSLISCIMVVAETYETGSSSFKDSSFMMDLFFCTFWLLNFLAGFIMTVRKIPFLLSMQSIVDITTVFPTFLILIIISVTELSRERFSNFTMIGIVRVLRLLRLKRTFGFLISKYSRNSKTAINAQFVKMGLNIVVGILVLAGLFNFVVTLNDADWGEGAGVMPFHTALYFTVVTVSTVGYGDISPSDTVGRVLLLVLMLVIFALVPTQTSRLIYLLSIKERYSGKVSVDRGNRHVIVCCDPSGMPIAKDAIKELSSHLHGTLMPHIVLLVPSDPDRTAKSLMLYLGGERAVTYLNGDARRTGDLKRARVTHASAVFLISSRFAKDSSFQDGNTLVRAVVVQQAAPNVKLYCSVVHSAAKQQLRRLGVVTAGVICQGKTIQALVSHACMTPGFCTVLSNLLTNNERDLDSIIGTYKRLWFKQPMLALLGRAPPGVLQKLRTEGLKEAEVQYVKSLSSFFARFQVGKYFSGESFSNVVSLIHSELELTMVALHLQPNSTTAGGLRRNSRMYDGNIMIERTETEPVLLHPGRAWLIGETDYAYIIVSTKSDLEKLYNFCVQMAFVNGRSSEKPVNFVQSVIRYGSLQKELSSSLDRSQKNGLKGFQVLMSPNTIEEENKKVHPLPNIMEELGTKEVERTPERWIFVVAHSLRAVKLVVQLLLRRGFSCIVLCPSRKPWNENSENAVEYELRTVSKEEGCGLFHLVRASLSSKGIQLCNVNSYNLCMALIVGGEGTEGESGYNRDKITVSLVVMVLSMVDQRVRVITYLNGASFVEQHEMLSRRIRVKTVKVASMNESVMSLSEACSHSIRDYYHYSLKDNFTTGDVVLSSMSEALLSQSFLLPGAESLFESLTNSMCAVRRVAIPTKFWSYCREIGVHWNYGELFDWLKNEYDIIAIGLQRLNMRDYERTQGLETHFLSIAVPSRDMEVNDNDWIYALLPRNVAEFLSKTVDHNISTPSKSDTVPYEDAFRNQEDSLALDQSHSLPLGYTPFSKKSIAIKDYGQRKRTVDKATSTSPRSLTPNRVRTPPRLPSEIKDQLSVTRINIYTPPCRPQKNVHDVGEETAEALANFAARSIGTECISEKFGEYDIVHTKNIDDNTNSGASKEEPVDWKDKVDNSSVGSVKDGGISIVENKSVKNGDSAASDLEQGTSEVCMPQVSEVCTPQVPEVCTPQVPEVCTPQVSEVCTPQVPEVSNMK